ncbi:putative Fimh-like protein [Pseudoalteromonas luteoviolacea B = ATCC 29581]|nr:putative Fimh-like protein [Pseudoalteromonas luteoviolacea B = ATCC 29581]
MKFRLILVSCALSAISSNCFAQTCFANQIASTTSSDNFVINSNGTVSDLTTGLMWQTCSYGQSYDNANEICINASAPIKWEQALLIAINNRFAGLDDWRVPNIKELASIIEHQCVEPSINKTVFFGTVNDNYWTSTTDMIRPDHAWVYQFSDGKNNLKAKNSDLFLRLVRFEK